MFHQTLLDQPMLTSLDSVNQMTLNISKWNMIDLSNQCWKSSSVIKSDCTVLYLYMKLKIKSRNFISRFEMLMAEIMFTYTCTYMYLSTLYWPRIYIYLLSNPVWTWCPLGGGWGHPSATDISPETTDSQPSGCWINPTLCHVPSHKTG